MITVRRSLITGVAVAVLVGSLTGCGGGGSTADPAASGTASTAPATSGAPSTTVREGVVHDFVVPAGTFAKLDRGEDPGIIPKRIDVHVGDSIRVRNDDTETVRLGLFNVAPGDTVTMDFNKVTVLSGVIFDDEGGGCGSPPPKDKVFIINVRP